MIFRFYKLWHNFLGWLVQPTVTLKVEKVRIVEGSGDLECLISHREGIVRNDNVAVNTCDANIVTDFMCSIVL